jgi:hypothetical protein
MIVRSIVRLLITMRGRRASKVRQSRFVPRVLAGLLRRLFPRASLVAEPERLTLLATHRSRYSYGSVASSERDPFELPELDHATRELDGDTDTDPLPGAHVTPERAGPKLGPKIAEGGMAELRLAFVRGDDGRAISVVLKRIRPELRSDPEVEAMFREEMRICSALDHVNIVRAIGVGELEGDPYIAFELLDAVSVRVLCGLGPIPVGPALAIAMGVARALDYGAAFELVHRDVTPENVLVTRDGVVKLVDFGIARFRGRELETMLGDLKGKDRYMAPEQLALLPVDARADLYALGVMLEEITAKPRPVPLGVLIALLCAPDPKDRPATSAEVLQALEIIPREAAAESLGDYVRRVHFLRGEERRSRAGLSAGIFWGLMAVWLALLIAAYLVFVPGSSG